MNSITLKPEFNELITLNEFILNELPEGNLQVDLIVEEISSNIINYLLKLLKVLLITIRKRINI